MRPLLEMSKFFLWCLVLIHVAPIKSDDNKTEGELSTFLHLRFPVVHVFLIADNIYFSHLCIMKKNG
jgi:hypothetical protein